jgi:RNA polymerase sigma-70 factor (ECF subfamily)
MRERVEGGGLERGGEARGRAPTGLDEEVRRHQAALSTQALRLTGDAREAEQLVHDVIERLPCNREDLPADTSVAVLMYAGMNDLFLERCRRRVGGPRLVVDRERPAPPHRPPIPAPRWARVSRAQLEACLAELPDDFRRVFELHARDGRSYDEIGQVLGMPASAVAVCLLRARLLLKDILRDVTADVDP